LAAALPLVIVILLALPPEDGGGHGRAPRLTGAPPGYR
jgi:hypothetical protein